MRKIKKSVSVLIVVFLIVMALASTAAASFVVTPRTNGSFRATTASYTNGESYYVKAIVETRRVNNTLIEEKESSWSKISATSGWLDSTGAYTSWHFGLWHP